MRHCLRKPQTVGKQLSQAKVNSVIGTEEMTYQKCFPPLETIPVTPVTHSCLLLPIFCQSFLSSPLLLIKIIYSLSRSALKLRDHTSLSLSSRGTNTVLSTYQGLNNLNNCFIDKNELFLGIICQSIKWYDVYAFSNRNFYSFILLNSTTIVGTILPPVLISSLTLQSTNED